MNDTSTSAENFLFEGYRRMAPKKKLSQVCQLNATVKNMALARIRKQYGPLTPREEKLRLAALWLPQEIMIKYCNWNPQEKGL